MASINAAASTSSSTPPPSLLLAHRPQGRLLVILGCGKLAASRARTAIEVGATPLVVPVDEGDVRCQEVQDGVQAGRIASRTGPSEATRVAWAEWLDEVDGEDNAIFAVCVTDTLHSGDDNAPDHQHHAGPSSSSSSPSPLDRAHLLALLCCKRRIPINVADRPQLCDFSFPATHRFALTTSSPSSSSSSGGYSPLQIAVTTNGRGCRLAGRIRRDLVSALPRNVGDAVQRVGELRDMAKQSSKPTSQAPPLVSKQAPDYLNAKSLTNKALAAASKQSRAEVVASTAAGHEDDLSYDSTPLNSPVPQLSRRSSKVDLHAAAATTPALQANGSLDAEAVEQTKRRMRWVAQMSEYWPIEYLGGMTQQQMDGVLQSLQDGAATSTAASASGSQTKDHRQVDDEHDERRGRSLTTTSPSTRARSQHSLSLAPPLPTPTPSTYGHIYLVGSGPGHPGLLTSLALQLLTSPSTHLILSDKLVPAPILRLIPASTPLIIARKFPGNAEGAQSELIELALKAAKEEGKNVLRLKQGDPFVYGRGGEEVLAFRKAGLQCTVVPGISSALAGPLMVGLPVTQRGAADSLVLCTGVGRGGKQVRLPGYERGRTLVVLMGVARLEALVHVLTSPEGEGRVGKAYPRHLPIALVERASSPDQRLVASTLEDIAAALEMTGEQRPPGMMMIGWSVLALQGGEEGNVGVLADGRDGEEGIEEDEEKDRMRVEKWLDREAVRSSNDAATTTNGGTGTAKRTVRYVLREGLDAVYSQSLREMMARAAANGEETAEAVDATRTATSSASPFDLAQRDKEAGWAPARYGAAARAASLVGGWTAGEELTDEQKERLRQRESGTIVQ